MAEKMYRVLEGARYTGKHKVYYGKGEMGRRESEVFPESELFGNADNLKMSLEGSEDVIKMRFDKDNKEIEGSEFVAVKGKEPKIEVVKVPAKKGKKKKEDEKK